MNIILIGIDYFADRGSSDKNFWFQLLPLLSQKIDNICIISFNYRKTKVENQSQGITIYNVKPFHLGIDLKIDAANVHNKEKCHSHFNRQPRSLIERTVSIIKIIPLIRKLAKAHQIKHLHFLDNFGPIMGIVKRVFTSLFISVTAMGYYARGRFHDNYLRHSFRKLDTIIPIAKAYKRKMVTIGIPKDNIRTIHWGINVSVSNSIDIAERNEAKEKLGLPAKYILAMWTGFIQQIGEDSLFASLEIARKILQKSNNVQFFFALKPECFKEEYCKDIQRDMHISSTNQKKFLQILQAADILLSPVPNKASIISPPLTWLECMANYIPVFTTETPGVEDVVKHGSNGYVVASSEQLISGIIECIKNGSYTKMGEKARKLVAEEYNIQCIANEYLNFWKD